MNLVKKVVRKKPNQKIVKSDATCHCFSSPRLSRNNDALVFMVDNHVPVHVVRQGIDVRRILILGSSLVHFKLPRKFRAFFTLLQDVWHRIKNSVPRNHLWLVWVLGVIWE